MKTAEEWEKQKTGEGRIYWASMASNSKDYAYMNVAFIQQIQLDAMKEGMRRAAAMYQRTAHLAMNTEHYDLRIYMTACGNIDKRMNKAILSAAEQLTEKDL